MASSSGSNAHNHGSNGNNNNNHGSNGNNNNNVRMSSRSHQEDLDSFLTTIESKLRGPFSSLDLAKAVSTTALKGGNVPSATSGSGSGGTNLTSSSSSSKLAGAAAAKAYLQSLSQVLSRPDKVIQCRMLIGLLGLAPDEDSNIGYDPSTSLTPEIYQILQETQVAPLHDEWVRTTSGLIQGIMFKKWHPADGHDNNNENDDDENDDDARESCRGDEAAKIIATTAGSDVTDIVEREIRREVIAHGNGKPEDLPPDLNACYAPYRYRLVSTPVLAAIIPEFHYSPDATKGRATGTAEDGTQNEENDEEDDDHDDDHDHDGPHPDHTNCHFRVSTRPNILQIDEQLEEQRAKEALHHTFGGTASSTGGGGNDKGRAVNKGSDNGNDKTSNTNGGISVTTTTFPPGFRRTQLVKTVKDANGKTSSMFMPKGKGGPGGTASTLFNTSTKHRPVPTKTLLRKKGGAQALVSRSTMKGRLVGMGPTSQGVGSAAVAAGGVTSPSATVGDAGAVASATTTSSSSPTTAAAVASLLPSSSLADKLAARRAEGRTYGGRGGATTTTNKGRSKMMMLDMNEADTLQQKQRSVEEDQQTSRMSKKRRILEMAKQKAGLTTTTTTTPGASGHGTKNGTDSGKGGGPKNGGGPALSSPPNKRAKTAASASSSSAIRGQQPQQPAAENRRGATTAAAVPSSTSSSPNHNTDDGWESLLGGRSNKISDEDRVRLQQFFENRRHNPYPDQPNVYKMKIHEQRGVDPETKQPIKETFYLELDYDEGKVQQSRKVKRY